MPAVLGVLVAAAAFGMAEQWAGAQWAGGGRPAAVAALGGMTAPWLALPFLAGASRARRRSARVLGSAVTLVALAGFLVANAGSVQNFLDSPSTDFLSMVLNPWYLGAVVSGLAYASLGYRWRVTRSWRPALAVTAPVMLEPGLRWWLSSRGMLTWAPYAPAAWAEALAGLALTTAAITIGRRGGTRERPDAKRPGGPVRRLGRAAGRAGVIAIAAVGVASYLLPLASPQVYGPADGSPPALTADGRGLYVLGQQSGFRGVWSQDLPTIVTRIDTATMQAETSVDVAPNAIGNSPVQAIVTHDNQILYVIDASSDFVAVRLRTGSPTAIQVPGGADSMTLSPDGSTLYVSAGDDTIVPVAAATARPGHPIRLPRGQAKDAKPGFLALTADGKTLYVDQQRSPGDSLFDEFVGINLVTGKAAPFDYRARDGDGMALTPDGRTLYLITDGDGYDGNPAPHDHRLIAVSTATGKQAGRALALPGAPIDLAVTPDGQTLYIACNDSVVRVPLSLATGGPAAQPATVIGWLGNEGDFALAISPDGRNLYAGGDGIQLIRLN